MKQINDGGLDAFLEGLSHMNGIFRVIQLLAACFMLITFLQSALDKIFNYKDNLAWMKGQFSKTFLAKSIPVFLPVLTLGELLSGLLLLIGVFQLVVGPKNAILKPAFLLSGIVLLLLLFGQRVSKEYAGAASLTGYFALVLLGLLAAGLYQSPHVFG